MNKTHLRFYVEKKRTLLPIVFFCLLLISFEVILWLTTDSLFSEFQSQINNSYEYSVVMKEPEGINDYYRYNAAIRFSATSDSNTALNVDVIMQIENSDYNNVICWNTSHMNTDGIAITSNIARANGIGVGDKLYSKHIVDGNIHEYTIKQILPNIVNVRYEGSISHNDGVIVMGYDSLYEDNITHDVIVFTKEPINVLTQNNSKLAVDQLYREDEIISIIKDLLPYILLFVLLGIVCCIGFVALMTKELSANFKRYVMLGYSPNIINKSYFRNVVLVGCLIELGIFAINIVLVISSILCFSEVLLMISCNLIEVLMIISTASILRNRLWRC